MLEHCFFIFQTKLTEANKELAMMKDKLKRYEDITSSKGMANSGDDQELQPLNSSLSETKQSNQFSF